ncbi:hypothetical protein MIB92_11310 [Aestuariirhabdus sp. Z084]|uniref:hypothetical protein n=1 Tax=Aestuariirhabdus haliotis TaxID=2918751 RepID=UPI00201B393E|nr:hypothetical protein [Aestuariirhabdus haliotis]MCL6416241.1 hypothetical protein [Aestuariirhabdus haliotis]MCL6420299.1 hypothetical protein [Aestuariirhabdus haliotis]
MKPHGDYRITLAGDILHVFPAGGFNAQGIIELHKAITLVAPKNNPWALFEHPYNNAGLTPDAIIAIIHSYQNLEASGCIAVALELSSTWQRVFQQSVIDKIRIPVYLDSDPENLETRLRQTLDGN